jgi:hypothetical protein
LSSPVLTPGGAHGQGILAHRNGDAGLLAELGHGLDGLVELDVFAPVAGSGHPVGGELHIAQAADVGGGHVGDGLADRHAAGGRRIEGATGVRSPMAMASPR